MNKNNWTYKKLGEVCKVTMGQSPNGNSVNDTNGIEFHQGKVFFGEKYLNVSNSFTEQPSKIAEPNSVLLCVRAPVGTVNITPRRICIGRGLCSIQPNDIIIMPFLFYALTQKQAYFDKNSTGSTFKAISSKVVINTILPIPPLAEQERIVAELDLLSSIIEKKKAQLKELDQLAQSIFYNMFGDPITNEKGWDVRKMEDLCENIVDCPHSTPKKVNYITKYPCIRTSELKGGIVQWETMQYLDENEYNKRIARLKPIAGDIVFGREGSIGDAVILPDGYYFSLGQRTMLLRANRDLISNIFLHRTILSEWVKRQIDAVNVSSTVAHVNIKDFKLFDIPLPPLPLQQEFADKVEAIERQKSLIQQSIDEVQTMFDSRMDYWFG